MASTLLNRGILLMAVFLGGCVSQTAQFSLPEKIDFQGKTFEKVTHNQIDEMQQLLYLPQGTDKNPDNWQQGVLIFLDKNSQGQTLQQRAALRQASFARQAGTLANVTLKGEELQSQVIYPPTERFADVQLEVSRGQNFACGFGQMQFADKRAVSAKKVQNLAHFQPLVVKLAAEFSRLAWQMACK